MTTSILVSDIRFAPASPSLRARGVIGWVCCVFDGIQFDGVAVRRSEDGRYFVSFPTRRDGEGKRHPYFKVLDESVRAAIEAQVIAELRRRGYLP